VVGSNPPTATFLTKNDIMYKVGDIGIFENLKGDGHTLEGATIKITKIYKEHSYLIGNPERMVVDFSILSKKAGGFGKSHRTEFFLEKTKGSRWYFKVITPKTHNHPLTKIFK
jgi:hypothetical protein